MTIDVDISLLSSLRSLNTRSTFRVRIKWTILKPAPQSTFSNCTLHQSLPPLCSTVHSALTALCTTHCSVKPTQSMQLGETCTELNTQQSTSKLNTQQNTMHNLKAHRAATACAQAGSTCTPAIEAPADHWKYRESIEHTLHRADVLQGGLTASTHK